MTGLSSAPERVSKNAENTHISHDGHPETCDNDVAKHKETVTGTSNLLRHISSIKVLMFDTEN